ncbi:aldo/keto reductase [Carnimonas bestiolae]|uniref:aldo/keto reductase n=1 Tax=Carnimonas bestiolae TaxID=3402172 RepID=UPI003EDC5316
MSRADIPTFTLNDGNHLPVIGFGTYQLNGREGIDSMVAAISRGYRLLDSAFNYENEGAVGQAVRQSEVPRDQLFVASKLPGRHHKYDQAVVTIEESLYRTGLDYLDLYLIHWPNPKQGLFVEAWQALIDAQKRGLVKSIGVSNFLPEHIDTLIKETGVAPAVNQVELSPYFAQDKQRAFDAKHNIVTEAWSPLGRASALLEDQHLQEIAARYDKSIVQIILRWHFQLGVLAIPKSSNPERQKQNLELFDFALSDDEMAAIKRLDRPDGRINDQDPAEYEEF